MMSTKQSVLLEEYEANLNISLAVSGCTNGLLRMTVDNKTLGTETTLFWISLVRKFR